MKSIKALIFGLMAIGILLNSAPSRASVGAIVAAPAVVTAGLITATVGLAGITGSVIYVSVTDFYDRNDGGPGIGVAIISGLVGIIGMIILDENQGMSYAEISKKDGLKLGLTAAEIVSYNHEIDQVNSLASYVDSKMAEMRNPTTKDASLVWESLDGMVAPETFSAMKKITIKMYKK